jgi:AcrR family transcriptional regulator
MKAATRHADVEDRLLDAADRLLARYGYRKMTMDDLANEVGIGKGTIYLHFRGKEDLVLSHLDRLTRRVINHLRKISASSATPIEKLRSMLIARVMYRFDSVQHFTESLSEVLRDLRPEVQARREQYFEAEAKVFAATLSEGQNCEAFRRQDCLITARALVTATGALLPFNLSVRELGKRLEVEERVGQIADLLLKGLVNTEAASKRPNLPRNRAKSRKG